MADADRNVAFGIRDGIDVALLRLLEQNGRASYRELGSKVHLSPNAVRQRLARLARNGIITGFRAEINWRDDPEAIEAVIDIRLPASADDEQFERAALELKGARTLEHLTGAVHYHLRVVVSDVKALDELVRTLKTRLGVESTTTRVVTRRLQA
jgi:Lrp/AsnC family leucine-responsive transcriptional regulator